MAESEARRGRPPGPAQGTYDAVLRTALELFLEGGVEALTFQRIADSTGVARTTIYRHWPDRAALIATMLEKATFPHHVDLLTGALEHDLDVALDSLVWRFTNRPVRRFLAALIDYGQRSDDVATTGEAYVDGLLRPVREVIEQAITRGDLKGDAAELTAEVAGPLMLRHVLLGESVTSDDALRVRTAFFERHATGDR